jgi:steroid 5-alpha reductase family enzyme
MTFFAPDLKLVLVTLAAAILPFIAIWAVSLRIKDASIVDVYWGPGFLVVAAATLALGNTSAGALLLFGAVAIWGVRLGLHIGIRKLKEGHEDGRYQAMRRTWKGSFAWQSLVWVFLLQGTLQWVVATPVWMGIAYAGEPVTWLLILGGAIYLVGVTIETIADWQLTQFIKNKKSPDEVCDVGLWSWSRHPNYFGETTLWWGIFLMALSVGAPVWTAIGPATITFLLLRVSGVTLLEKGLKKRKPAYAEYARRTSAFIPWPPKRP